jgi:hypothetical protein
MGGHVENIFKLRYANYIVNLSVSKGCPLSHERGQKGRVSYFVTL